MGKKKYNNPFPWDTFWKQIQKLMRENGLQNAAQFDKYTGLINKANRWQNPDWRTGSVELDTLLTISKKFNKPIDWLLGGGTALQATEAAADLYDARPLPPLNENLLIFTLATVEEYLVCHQKKLLTLQKGRLICKLYEHCLETKERPTSHLVDIYLRITE